MNNKWEDRPCGDCKVKMGCPHSLFAGRFAIELPKFMKDKFMKEYCFVNKIESYKE